MYEFIRGIIVERNPAHIVIEAGGIGYYINISLNTYSKFNQKTEGLIYLHQAVREDAHVFYGFAEKSERELFRNLISVNGVGANTAIMMLSSLNPDEIAVAVTTENVAVLKAVKGIGIKTAQRIIIDLKDKLGKLNETSQIFLSPNNTILNESLSALVMLGFVKRDAEKVVAKILQEQPLTTVEGVIKLALKRL
ncbi:MAG TPA: Holliday junction branch migration protein RuvA [Draconibacterium sp.]|jgi:holliday junction DNA helicase RuvA|nr:Holliday junction branch migration protein RuvA [Draconibacterium sp.]